jgi:O-antigen ligase
MRTIAYWILLLLIFTIPADSMLEFGNFGTISKVVGVLLVVFWIAKVIITKKIRKPHVFHIVFAAFALWHIASILWTIDFDKTQVRFQTYFQLIGLSFIIWDLITTPEALRAGLQAYVLGSWMSIGNMIYNYIFGITRTYTRFTAGAFDSNNIGIILALGIPIAWYLIIHKGSSKFSKFLTVVNYLYLPAAVFGILLTGSRAAFITTAVAFIYVVGNLKNLKFYIRVLSFFALVFSLYGVYTMIPDALLQRLSTTGDSIASADLHGRVAIWRASADVIEEHPLIGIGSNAFESSTALKKAAHNTYLSILVEVGLIGFLLFATAVALTIYNAIQHPSAERRFWLAILMVLAVGILTLNWTHRKQTWLFPSLIVASTTIIVKHKKLIQPNNLEGKVF